MKRTTKVNIADGRREAERLNKLGALRVRWSTDGAIPEDREKVNKVRCIGFAISSDERDCLLFNGPYGADGRFTVRCVPIDKIQSIEFFEREAATDG